MSVKQCKQFSEGNSEVKHRACAFVSPPIVDDKGGMGSRTEMERDFHKKRRGGTLLRIAQ